MSSEFPVPNGVRQGKVLSSILFCISIDELLHRLKTSGYGYGCYIICFVCVWGGHWDIPGTMFVNFDVYIRCNSEY